MRVFSTDLCKYRDIAGIPGQGVHSTRFIGVAAFDLFGTIIIAFAVARYMNWDPVTTIILALILGEIAHLAFCVDTPITRAIKN
jgi:hypothetical protein